MTDIMDEYNISISAVYRIRNSKESLENFKENKGFAVAKKFQRQRKSSIPNVEKALYNWFLKERGKFNYVSNQELKEKALEFHKQFDVHVKFEASNGWLERFRERNGLLSLKVCGERLSANASAIPGFISEFKEKMIAMDLKPEQIYNADETGLMYKEMPHKTLQSRQRITLLACVNATGRHKLPLMFIGKSKSPRCFKDRSLPDVYYKSSKNAWQTQTLFLEWFEEVFIPKVTSHLVSQGLPAKAVLLVDNATCHNHPTILSYGASKEFQVLFFHTNTASLLQPLEQQIIWSFKTSYRKLLLLHLLKLQGSIEEKFMSIELFEVLFFVNEAWDKVSRKVILNGWKPLFEDSKKLDLNEENFDSTDDNLPLIQLFRKVANDKELNDKDIRNWAGGKGECPETGCEDKEIIDESTEDSNEENAMDSNYDIDSVVSSFKCVINWAMKQNLDLSDLQTLQKLSNKAAAEKNVQKN